MHKLASSVEYILVPVSGPVTDLTVYAASMAIVGESSGEPADTDYQAAAWIGGEIAYKPAAGALATGVYDVYVRIIAGAEDVRLLAGRLRVGDPRT